MGKVWVTEFAQTATDARGHDVPCPKGPALRTTVVDFSGVAAAMSDPIGSDCAIFGLCADAAFHLLLTPDAADPADATTNMERIPANTIVYRGLQLGNPENLVVSAIAAA